MRMLDARASCMCMYMDISLSIPVPSTAGEDVVSYLRRGRHSLFMDPSTHSVSRGIQILASLPKEPEASIDSACAFPSHPAPSVC